MESLYLLIPLGIVLVGAATALFAWALVSGQYDDLGQWSQRMPDADPERDRA